MHLADVVLQVEGGGEVGLAVVPRANQHGLVGGVDALVPPQGVHLLELLLTRLACKCGCSTMSRDEIRCRLVLHYRPSSDLVPKIQFFVLDIYFWM